jgi:uncharacterized RDD family membrane protein YckC
MERTVDVATGESVAFSYELAGLGSRFFAMFIDFSIQLAVAAAALAALAAYASTHPSHHVKLDPHFETTARAIIEAVAIVFAFLLFFGYFIIFEWRSQGRTPGKRLLGIRVVRDGGFPLDFTSAVIRNVVRILEFGAGFYAVSAVSTLLSPMNRRLGDYAAGTIVVRDAAYERVSVFVPAIDVRSDDPLVRDLSDAERDLVRNYVDRRPNLGRAARATVAAQIALVVRPKLGANFAHLGDDDLLVHLAATALATS